jgi:hypothetical protein
MWAWARCKPRGIRGQGEGRKDLRDADFVHFRGICALNMSRCSQPTITGVTFLHLTGIHTLDMSDCPEALVAAAHARGLPVCENFSRSNQRTACERILFVCFFPARLFSSLLHLKSSRGVLQCYCLALPAVLTLHCQWHCCGAVSSPSKRVSRCCCCVRTVGLQGHPRVAPTMKINSKQQTKYQSIGESVHPLPPYAGGSHQALWAAVWACGPAWCCARNHCAC